MDAMSCFKAARSFFYSRWPFLMMESSSLRIMSSPCIFCWPV